MASSRTGGCVPLDEDRKRRKAPLADQLVHVSTGVLQRRPSASLGVEGLAHADAVRDDIRSDDIRSAALRARGFRVLSFWNDEVLRELDSVCDTIIAYVRDTRLQPWR